jgi:hypothetical protein
MKSIFFLSLTSSAKLIGAGLATMVLLELELLLV